MSAPAVLLCVVIVLFLIAQIRVGCKAEYDQEGVRVFVRAAGFHICVFPVKKKEKKQKPKKAKKPKKEKKPKDKKEKKKKDKKEKAKKEPKKGKEMPKEEKKEKGGSILDFLPLVQVGLDLLNDFRWKLRLNRLELKLIMAADDPADLGINYGRAWAAVGNLVPMLERSFIIKKKDIEVECDFTSSETLVVARLDITITLGRIISLAVVTGIRALREFLKIMKKRKGGAVK
jgi:hypothetical protein